LFFQGVGTLSDTDKQLIQRFGESMSVAADNHITHIELDEDQRVTLQRLGSFAEEPYQESNNHKKRIALICRALGQAAGLDSHDAKLLYRAAPLHDVGKIDVPDEILHKPGKLDPEEWKMMQTHTKAGFDLLLSSEMEVLKAAAGVAKSHHENWDGSGYPDGLKGEDIPLFGRIAAIADVFDSLVSNRCYRDDCWPAEEAFEYLVAQSGNKFDPDLIKVAIRIKEQLLNIETRYPDDPLH
jgi:response regulator RpfG family c-di-GMP phosphodiesterase